MYRQFYHVSSLHKKTAYPAIIPIRKTSKSAGYDIALNIDLKLKPREQKLFWTDVKASMLDNEFLMIVIRSSLAVKHNLALLNAIGIIDADYVDNEQNDGNIGLPIINNSRDTVLIPAGTAIAQGIFMNYNIVVNDVCNDERMGGFGSTTKE